MHTERNAGLAAGLAAYVTWALLTLFWVPMRPVAPLEILAWRIIWSCVAVAVVLTLMRKPWGWLSILRDRTKLPRLAAASAFIAINWGVYILAVTTNHVVEASLGYFISPLANVAFGALIFGERLPLGGKIGGALAALGVLVIAGGNWQGIWISLILAGSWGLYSVFKKRAHLPALQGLLVESGLLVPLALAYVVYLAATAQLTFTANLVTTIMTPLTGPATALPLFLFALAAARLPLGPLGVLQYVSPSLTFIMGITFFGQHVTPSYWAGLILVWIGSAVFLATTLRRPAPLNN